MPREFKNRLIFNPEDTKLWDEVPKIDIQVAKVTKKTSIPFEDSSNLKDPMDRKTEGLLKKAWECSSALINVNITATSVARSMGLWRNQLENHLRLKTPREDILESIPLLRMATAYLADASAESIRISARNSTLANTARRALWLRSWSGDVASKNKLCSIPFSGSHVFGPVLDTILESAADRKKGFPEERSKKTQSFRKDSGQGQTENFSEIGLDILPCAVMLDSWKERYR
ncbi:lamina-associated polypeptide 2, isoforms alpha/zeta-like [Bufo bufo]|uniref:lamina-associated polypeptide 2, isoforms alpha/zeta-like n=1 Tax=Bufo bufo TaxID=8384 RepID=UPI001ABE2184|nr:lamina-associated polypeptide 2, isoforms alpha/zeta-like [Bufo bufo]